MDNRITHITKAEMARRHIQSMILSGEVGPDDRITTREVSEALGISETPIREAIRSLASEGWLEIQNHIGAVVQGLKTEQILEISRLRGLICGLAIELGASDFDGARLNRIDENIKEYAKALAQKDYQLVVDKNKEFHELLSGNANSPWCQRLLDNMHGLISAQRHGLSPEHSRLATALDEHKGIRDMLRVGDFTTAAEMVKQHEINTGDFLIKMISEVPEKNQKNLIKTGS